MTSECTLKTKCILFDAAKIKEFVLQNFRHFVFLISYEEKIFRQSLKKKSAWEKNKWEMPKILSHKIFIFSNIKENAHTFRWLSQKRLEF